MCSAFVCSGSSTDVSISERIMCFLYLQPASPGTGLTSYNCAVTLLTYLCSEFM